MNSPTNKSAFTLLQLLVVIALIAILAVLLLSGIGSIRDRANDVRCVSNLRQLGLASLTFMTENNGRLFPSMFWYNPSTHPTDRGMRDYVGMVAVPPAGSRKATVFTCPALQDKFASSGADPMQRTYGVNFYAHAVNVAYRNDPNPAVRNALQFPGILLNIAYPSKMWMITESYPLAGAGNFSTYIRPGAGDIGRTFSPHSKCQNAVFFDGHVSKMDMTLFTDSSTPQNKTEYDAFWGTLRR